MNRPLLVVVDMQRYYLEADSPFSRFHSHVDPGCLDHIRQRCRDIVIPNLQRLIKAFRGAGFPVVYLRLCGESEDRSDLQHTFSMVHCQAACQGYPNLYPLRSDPLSEVIPALAPEKGDHTFFKTTYSGFTSSPEFGAFLAEYPGRTLLFCGLATSQCVDTTARDAADRDYSVIHVEDGQADYSDTAHRAALYSSQGVCGGRIVDTHTVLSQWELP
jgi:nicotinamidase-related amidase